MAQFTVNPHRFDPYKNFKFRVRWDGEYIAGISSVSGLRRSTTPIHHREGGNPSSSRKSPGITQYHSIIMERGVTHDTAFEEWANMVQSVQGDSAMSLKDFRKDIEVELLNEQGSVVKRWLVYRCWVSEYEIIGDLDANSEATAIERIKLENEGWERDAGVDEPLET